MPLYGQLPQLEIENGTKVDGIRVKVPNPPKTATIRLPNTQEMIDRINQRGHLKRKRVDGKIATDFAVDLKQADLNLFKAIRLDHGTDFDEAEAQNAITLVTACDVTKIERQGDEYNITI